MTALPRIEGDCVWHGAEMATSDRWIVELTGQDIAALDAALAHVEARGTAWHDITRESFPLGSLS